MSGNALKRKKSFDSLHSAYYNFLRFQEFEEKCKHRDADEANIQDGRGAKDKPKSQEDRGRAAAANVHLANIDSTLQDANSSMTLKTIHTMAMCGDEGRRHSRDTIDSGLLSRLFRGGLRGAGRGRGDHPH
jgi:hypothetical protein